MTLLVKNYIDGDTAVSYDDGKKCYRDILKILDNGDNVIFGF